MVTIRTADLIAMIRAGIAPTMEQKFRECKTLAEMRQMSAILRRRGEWNDELQIAENELARVLK